jgi:hypothetical protein
MTRTFRNCLAATLFLALVPAARAGTVYVANNGLDSASCGAHTSPCRTITRGITNAGPGDHIIVGPGMYRGESGAPSCSCFVAINKRVSLMSSDGAASTVIDARGFLVSTNVLLIADGSEFGRPGKGFTVTNPKSSGGAGIAIDSKHVKVRGNQVIADSSIASPGIGIATVASNAGPMLIEANQVMLWTFGISAVGDGKTASKNQVSLNAAAMEVSGSSRASGNVVSGNGQGLTLVGAASAVGNAVYGNNGEGINIDTSSSPFSGMVSRNDIAGNDAGLGNCGLFNVGVPGLDATNNYWGASTGPGPDPADNVCNNGGTTMTTPFAMAPFRVKASIKP